MTIREPGTFAIQVATTALLSWEPPQQAVTLGAPQRATGWINANFYPGRDQPTQHGADARSLPSPERLVTRRFCVWARPFGDAETAADLGRRDPRKPMHPIKPDVIGHGRKRAKGAASVTSGETPSKERRRPGRKDQRPGSGAPA